MDIILAVLQALVATITAYLGVHLTLHPVGESAKTKLAYKVSFIGCGIVSVCLIAFQTYRNDQAQEKLQGQLSRIETNTKTPPNVQVNVPPAQVIINPSPPDKSVGSLSLAKVEFPPSLDANPFAVNIHLMNVGQVPIPDAYFWEIAEFRPIGQINSQDDSNAADKKAYNAFSKLGKKALLDSRKAGHSPVHYSVGEEHWGTISLHPRSEEIDGVMRGTVRLYFFAIAAWDGGKSQYTACRWLQPPTEVNYGSGANLVLHDCVW